MEHRYQADFEYGTGWRIYDTKKQIRLPMSDVAEMLNNFSEKVVILEEEVSHLQSRIERLRPMAGFDD